MSELPTSMCEDRPPFELFVEGRGVVQRLYIESFALFVYEAYVKYAQWCGHEYANKRIILYKNGAIIEEYNPPLISELLNYFQSFGKAITCK
jgi:hypothetical protein